MSTSTAQVPRRHRHSVVEYHRMATAGLLAQEARVELIEGEIIDRAPIASRHASIVKKLSRLFQASVGNSALVSVQDPVRLSDFSEPQPDLALLRWRADFYSDAHPAADDLLLVVEVSDTTLEFDRDVKLPLYARYGVAEAWLVDVDGKTITSYAKPTEAGYQLEQRIVGIVAPTLLQNCSVDADALW